MSSKSPKSDEVHERGCRIWDDVIWKATLVAISLGIVVTVVLVISTQEEPYSVLYLKQGSYSNYLEDDMTSFTYGVECFENKETHYNLKIFLGDKHVIEKSFTLGTGGSIEDNITFDIPHDVELPSKVSLLLTVNNRNYSTHFWLNGRK